MGFSTKVFFFLNFSKTRSAICSHVKGDYQVALFELSWPIECVLKMLRIEKMCTLGSLERTRLIARAYNIGECGSLNSFLVMSYGFFAL